MTQPKGKYAWTVKVGEKGQIVIPKEARDVFNIKPGDTLILLGDEEQGIAIPPKNMFDKISQMVFGEIGADSDKDVEK
ncbi:MAG: AbrB/MazE/SpoVT family DNA-binding domain-containing protein [Acetobacterium woodii]|nr:AbrB/MazE/SpoVT family DNA-binding domain-containing protein [Acetobacterium woodii]